MIRSIMVAIHIHKSGVVLVLQWYRFVDLGLEMHQSSSQMRYKEFKFFAKAEKSKSKTQQGRNKNLATQVWKNGDHLLLKHVAPVKKPATDKVIDVFGSVDRVEEHPNQRGNIKVSWQRLTAASVRFEPSLLASLDGPHGRAGSNALPDFLHYQLQTLEIDQSYLPASSGIREANAHFFDTNRPWIEEESYGTQDAHDFSWLPL